MFTRSRGGRRASPARLSVERLEDRVVPHGPPLGAGLSAAALVGPAAVTPRPDGPSHEQPGPHFDLPNAGQHTGPAEGHGPTKVLGRGNAGESDGPVLSLRGESTPEHSPAVVAPLSGETGAGSILGRDKAPGTTGGKDQEKSDASDSEASSRHAASADHSSGTIIGRGNSSPAVAAHGQTAAPAVTRSPAPPAADEESPQAGPAAELASGKAEGGFVGPLAAAVAPAGDSDAGASARPAGAGASAFGVFVPVSGLLAAAADGAEGSVAGTAPAGSPAAGNGGVLAVLDARSAGPAVPHGAAGPADDFLEVPPAGEVTLVRGGTPAEPADLGAPDGPAAPLAAYVGYAPQQAPAVGLLDRLGLDTRALDAALQNFLHGLDRLGGRLADPRTRLGVSAWVLTGAAALAVVEVNRRRRAAAAGHADGVPLTWLDPEGPAPEPAV